MLSISDPMKGAGAEDYYLNLAREDYYKEDGEQPGYWLGKGARHLKLFGKVEPQALRHLLDGFTPDGRHSLVQNAGAADRQRGWDLTLSAPKCVSVLWALAPADMQAQIEDALRDAEAHTVRYIEREAGVTRRGKGGAIKEQAALVCAAFPHITSRAQDPQLHTHVLLINLGLRSDGTSGTLESRNFFRAKKEVGKVYRNELATQLMERLNLEIQPEKIGFHIHGVPKELCQEFSKRARAVRKLLTEWGLRDAVSAKDAALLSRSKKHSVPREELFAEWRRVGQKFGWTEANAAALWKSRREEKPVQKRVQRPSKGNHTEGFFREQLHPTQIHISNRAPEEKHSIKKSPPQKTYKLNRESLLRVRWRLMFPRRRKGKFGSDWKAPRVTFGNAPKLAKWDAVLWKRDLLLTELRVQKRNLFRSAPGWSPFREFKLPVIKFDRGEPIVVWENILWKKNLLIGELRLQERRVFPDAPKWSPFRKLKVPALRLSPSSQFPRKSEMGSENSREHSYSRTH